MPAKVHRNVRSKVHRALFLATLEHLLAQADEYIDYNPLLEGPGFANAPKAAFWTVVVNRLGVSYVRALIRFTDGSELQRSWLVSKGGRGVGKGGSGSIWIKYLPLDKYQKLLYPDRARGWATVDRGGVPKRSTRSRPSIGRSKRPR